jgi:NADH-quinone oxidoreductase subunit A
MLIQYGTVLAFMVAGFSFVLISLFAGKIIRPAKPDSQKNMPYECGEIPVGTARVNWNMRFYIIALIFVIFDIEIAFIYPVAAVYKTWIQSGAGLIAFTELLIFTAILFVGLIYLWAKGDLEWVRSYYNSQHLGLKSLNIAEKPDFNKNSENSDQSVSVSAS